MREMVDAVAYIRGQSEEQMRRSDALVRQQAQLTALMARSQQLEHSLNEVGRD